MVSQPPGFHDWDATCINSIQAAAGTTAPCS